MQTKTVARTGLLTALAMILSYVESRIPVFVAIPGIKIGLANVVVVFALYKSGFKQASLIAFLKVLISAFIFGNVLSWIYSASGALLSLLGMAALKKSGLFGTVAVSVAGGVLHNIGQIIAACILLETSVIMYYIPVLILSGTVAGILIGIAGAVMIKRIDIG